MEQVHAAIDSVRSYYQEHGIFRMEFGFGQRPALLVIDMAYGWTDPAYATGSQRLDAAVEGILQLLPACRQQGVPVIYTTSPFRQDDVDPMFARPGHKEYRPWDERACQIDSRLQPEAGDFIIYKENASAFFGTHLAPYLVEHRVDTLIITGCSTSACVRASATDARAYRLRAIVPRQGVQDRAAAAHEWNLFDIDAKFGDVVENEQVIEYLQQLQKGD
ncbi:MAG: isochorismatase family protein [Candidatus Latescibacteria bacterium]|nr:isochorismatase family protein [Candidatus Latescibacterota bacterium]